MNLKFLDIFLRLYRPRWTEFFTSKKGRQSFTSPLKYCCALYGQYSESHLNVFWKTSENVLGRQQTRIEIAIVAWKSTVADRKFSNTFNFARGSVKTLLVWQRTPQFLKSLNFTTKPKSPPLFFPSKSRFKAVKKKKSFFHEFRSMIKRKILPKIKF